MDSSIPAGTVCQFGTFKANGVELARPSNPTKNGNIHQYDASETYLFGDTSATAANNLQWVKLSNTLLVCDRCILCDISWQNIYKNYTSRVYDKSRNNLRGQTKIIGAQGVSSIVTIDGYTYRVRLLTGGTSDPGTGSEWDAFSALCSGDNSKMNWQNIYTWCSETATTAYATARPLRGSSSADGWSSSASTRSSFLNMAFGFRPVLELVE